MAFRYKRAGRGAGPELIVASGKRYRVRYRDPDRQSREKNGFVRKKDAEDFLANITVATNRGEFVDPKSARATILELGSAWIANQTHLKPSSLRPVEIAWRLHVQPTWGARRVGEIQHSDVQGWISSFSKGRSATTVLRAHGVLAAILDVAVRDRRISVNPARGVKVPKKAKGKHQYLSGPQVELFAAQAPRNRALVYTLAYTGMRWGEATGLQVGSLDFDRRRALIERNAVKVGQQVFVGTTKTHEKRSVPFPRFLEPLLREECRGKAASELVFGDGVTHMRTPHSLSGWFVFALKRCQAIDPSFPTITPHDLRHTAASLAISAGANVKAVQRMLGHASAAMTLDIYADLFEDDLDDVSDRLDKVRSESFVGFLWGLAPDGQKKTP